MKLHDFGVTLLIAIAVAWLLGATIFAVHDPGSKTGFYQPDPPCDPSVRECLADEPRTLDMK